MSETISIGDTGKQSALDTVVQHWEIASQVVHGEVIG